MASNAKNLAEYLNNQTTSATADIADGSITTDKLAADAVTAAKLADNAVVSANLSAGALEGSGVNLGRRNLVINGSFQIFQRATAATAATGYNTADRWHFAEGTDGAYTSERSTDNPFGTGHSIKLQCTTADTSLAASQFARVYQRIEAQNLQHLLYGTSSAKTLTLSFWVKSSKTGTYSILLRKEDNTAYHFIHSYTISSANTWEKKVITITPTAGSTSFITASAGAIANDNGMGFELAFNLAQGSTYAIGTSNTWSSNASTYGLNGQVNWLDNTSNNLYLAEVQLEVGASATDFEHRPISEELDSCHRYFFKPITQQNYAPFPIVFNRTVSTGSNGYFAFTIPLPKPMRTLPTFTHNLSNSNHAGSGSAAAAGNWQFYWQNQGWGNYAGSGNMNTINRAMAGDSCVHLGNYYITPSAVQFDQLAIGKDLTLEFSAEL